MILILHSFGGHDGSSYRNDIYKIDTTGFDLSIINPKNPDDGPMKKNGCGMVPYKKSLVIFGGVGDAPPTPNLEHLIRMGGLMSYIYWISLKVSELFLLVLIVLSGLRQEFFFRGG